MSLKQQLREIRENRGLSQAQLAKNCGWDRASRISNYESGLREPTLEDIKKMARALDVNPLELVKEELEINSSTEFGLPLYSWNELKPIKIINKIAPPSCYALQLDDDSMSNTNEFKPTFPKGTFIIIDPIKKIEPGQFVIARLKDKPDSRPIFRKFTTDYIKEVLVPLNVSVAYDFYLAKDFDILGVAVASMTLDL